MLQIDKPMSGGEVEVKLGDSFEVRLPENPTTGYRWRLNPSGGPAVEVQEDSFEHSGGPYGAGGIRHWRLRAVAEGTAELTMDYRRGWEQWPAETFKITIRVRPR